MIPTRNWLLTRIADGGGNCEYCGASIRWEYHLHHPDDKEQQITVGSECVKSLTAACDPDVARGFIFGHWKQRRRYYYRRVGSRTWIIGPSRDDQNWYIAYSEEGVRGDWTFLDTWYAHPDAAKQYLSQHHAH